MSEDPFASHLVSLVLAWVACAPAILGGLGQGVLTLGGILTGRHGRLFILWLAICVILLSPFRYLLFQLFVGISYPWQSFYALLTSVVLSVYVPIVFGLLFLTGVGLPVAAAVGIAGLHAVTTLPRRLVAGVLAPILCAVGTSVFAMALPLAGWTVRWLDPLDVIRATNGPAYYVFRYVAWFGTPLSFPVPPEALPPSQRDVMRLHVASAYMSPPKEAWVVRTGFPELFAEFYTAQ